MADDTNADREALFHRGLEAYRARCHFDAFDIWTQVYEAEKDETNRRFLQALLQVTNAMHKVRHNAELRGSLHLLERAIIKLDQLPDVYGGLDLATFRDGTRTCLAEIARLLSVKIKEIEDHFIPRLDTVGQGPVLEPRAQAPAVEPDKLLQAGLAAYRDGRFYEAHELWEEFKRTLPEDAPDRELSHSLILIATAMHKLHRAKSPSGAAQLLELALDKLREIPEGSQGIDIAHLVSEVKRVHSAVEDLEVTSATGSANIEPTHIPEIRNAGA